MYKLTCRCNVAQLLMILYIDIFLLELIHVKISKCNLQELVLLWVIIFVM